MPRSLPELAGDVAEQITSVLDFPKNGINFRDVMPLMRQPVLLGELCEAIADHIRSKHGKVDAIVALEARGFLFGPQVAILLGTSFVPIRKKGKLPGECYSAVYVKEYGEDVVEMQKNALVESSRVVIIDDLLATGGTLIAALDVVSKAKAEVVEVFVVCELAGLKAREKIPKGVEVHSLVVYPGA